MSDTFQLRVEYHNLVLPTTMSDLDFYAKRLQQIHDILSGAPVFGPDITSHRKSLEATYNLNISGIVTHFEGTVEPLLKYFFGLSKPNAPDKMSVYTSRVCGTEELERILDRYNKQFGFYILNPSTIVDKTK